jgi:hypothetical protein
MVSIDAVDAFDTIYTVAAAVDTIEKIRLR